MTTPTVSVVVVSRGRPHHLKRCLLGISQLQDAHFEVVVVADPQGMRATRSLPFADAIKAVPFDQANISAARNLGIQNAAGDWVAFIDDDAVPEPSWLRSLMQPSQEPSVAAIGGFVRGRNGISWQWRARGLDPLGRPYPLDNDGSAVQSLRPPDGHAIKTEGTNMAVRRAVLAEMGGFDPAFHYFLDETDLNMRLARLGYKTALVPWAEVHHGFAANVVRRSDRVPRDLFDIGASWAVFLRKHVPALRHRARRSQLRSEERQRLLRHMVTGAIDPVNVSRLLRRLDDGFAAGLSRAHSEDYLSTKAAKPFAAFPVLKRTSQFLSTRPRQLGETLQQAAQLVADGEIVTVLSLSRTAAFHKVAFTDAGVWLQRGGIFGKAQRDEPLIAYFSRAERVLKERNRVAKQRTIKEY